VSENLKIWESVCRVPPEHLKGFKRGGGFTGTAIKPMWSFKTMTEQFGPCGKGWGMTKPEFQIIDAGSEKLVFCTVGVWHGAPESIVYGVGGDKPIVQFSSGAKADDEAFKKAYTDALTNALKLLGVAADIHMGLWDGNKYADEEPEPKANSRKPLTTVSGDPATPKAQSREPYEKISKGIREICQTGTVEDLLGWYASHKATISAFDDGFHQAIMAEFSDAKSELKEKMGGEVAAAHEASRLALEAQRPPTNGAGRMT
jgi:hypothetical protein